MYNGDSTLWRWSLSPQLIMHIILSFIEIFTQFLTMVSLITLPSWIPQICWWISYFTWLNCLTFKKWIAGCISFHHSVTPNSRPFTYLKHFEHPTTNITEWRLCDADGWKSRVCMCKEILLVVCYNHIQTGFTSRRVLVMRNIDKTKWILQRYLHTSSGIWCYVTITPNSLAPLLFPPPTYPLFFNKHLPSHSYLLD